MIRRAVNIAVEMVPSLDLWIRSAILVAMGGAALYLAPYVPLAGWTQFAGKFFLVVSVYWFLLPSLETLLRHATAFVKHRGSRAGWAILGCLVVLVSVVTLLARDEDQEEDMG